MGSLYRFVSNNYRAGRIKRLLHLCSIFLNSFFHQKTGTKNHWLHMTKTHRKQTPTNFSFCTNLISIDEHKNEMILTQRFFFNWPADKLTIRHFNSNQQHLHMRNFKCDNFFGMFWIWFVSLSWERLMSLIRRFEKEYCSVAPIHVGARIMIKFNRIGTC